MFICNQDLLENICAQGMKWIDENLIKTDNGIFNLVQISDPHFVENGDGSRDINESTNVLADSLIDWKDKTLLHESNESNKLQAFIISGDIIRANKIKDRKEAYSSASHFQWCI